MQPLDSIIERVKEPEPARQAVTVGRMEDVPPGRAATIEIIDGRELALYNVDGEFYAVENFCPHKGAPLANGNLCGHTVECDWHGWQFDVRTGKCLTTTSGDIESYKVVLEDGLIKILI